MELRVPFAQAKTRLLEYGSQWMVPLACDAYQRGEAALLRVGPSLLPKKIRLEFEFPHQQGDTLILPLHWIATGAASLFPRMQADLQLEPGYPRTKLRFRGQYEPPLGAVGRAADRVVMHRIAENTVRCFLRDLVKSLESKEPIRMVQAEANA